MQIKIRTMFAACLLAAIACSTTGCIVGQPPGNGKVMHLQEPSTGGWYYLYLPEDYVQGGRPLTGERWPLVVTFHGMRPFDDAGSQIREWQQEADRYGFVVLAPKTETSDLLRQFASVRVRSVTPAVRRDEALTLAAMDEIARRVDIDPTKVLTTSWSSGGYLAHYMINRHPERFTCIAPRQSNFSSDILDDAQVPRYRDVKVGIFYTENDFAICQRESQEGAQWYASRGFDVTFAVFRGLGHARRPSVAADFFARQIGATAKTPPTELARMQVTRVPLPGLNGKNGAKRNGNDEAARTVSAEINGKAVSPAELIGDTDAAQSAPQEVDHPSRAMKSIGPGQSVSAYQTGGDDGPLRVRVSSTIGIAPHHVNFSALAPEDLTRGASFLWTDNGEPITNGINGQKYLLATGEHLLEVFMTTRDNREFTARKTITVLARANKSRR